MKGKFFAAAIAAMLVGPLFGNPVMAQTSQPQFLITWQATNSYVPTGYVGKILPNANSEITASLELISQGNPVSLSNQTVYWYLNDNLLGGAVGAQRINFRAPGGAPATLTLRVSLPDYAGGLSHEIEIPVVQPSVVINAPYPNGIATQSQISMNAVPYFFNASSVNELGFSWNVNGQTVVDAQNPQTLQVSLPANTPSGFAITTVLTITNPNDSTVSTANETLTYQPHS